MAASFRADQVTPGAGTPGQARHDLVAGEIITLTAISPSGGGITYTWEILDKINAPLAVLSSTTGTSVTIGPAEAIVQPCTFLVRMLASDGTYVSRVFSVRTLLTDLRIPAYLERSPITNTLSSNDPDLCTDNAVYSDLTGLGAPGQNWRGWAEAHFELVMALETVASSSGGAQNNYSGLAAPGVDDDETEGYSTGSFWQVVVSGPDDGLYYCIDASVGAAFWYQIIPPDVEIPEVPAASDAIPSALGTAAAGNSEDFSRANHVHALPQLFSMGAAIGTTSVDFADLADRTGYEVNLGPGDSLVVNVGDGSPSNPVGKLVVLFQVAVGNISVVAAGGMTVNVGAGYLATSSGNPSHVFVLITGGATCYVWGDLVRTSSSNLIRTYVAGGTNKSTTLIDTEEVLGGFVFDPSDYTAGTPAIRLTMLGVLTVAGAGEGTLRLYDLGAPGAPAAPVLRAEVTILNGLAGVHTRTELSLTPSVFPSSPGEIDDGERMYELRLLVDGGTPGDDLLCLWGGIVVDSNT